MKITTEAEVVMKSLRHASIAPAHPGAMIADVVEHLGMTKVNMARRMGVTRAALHNVISERSAVTADFAVRFERVTGTSADLLLRMQYGLDLWRARQTDAEQNDPRPDVPA